MKIDKMVSIIVTCAKQYQRNLANRNLLFVFGNPKSVETLEIVCLPENFMHLTGVLPANKSLSSVNFYNMCLDSRLTPNAIKISHGGTTTMKLRVLAQTMSIHETARMIGSYSGNKIKLNTEKIAGNTRACVGFVEAKEYPGFYVPNTVLYEDTRKVIDKPAKKIMAIFTKQKNAPTYTECTYLAKEASPELFLSGTLKSKITI